jgi:uncharacterized protein involved in exopolysaccharide biosynthesis
MKPREEDEEKFLVSLSDLKGIWMRGKRTILSVALAVAATGIALALLRPVRYEAEGSFREKGVKTSNVSTSSVIQLLSNGSLHGTESEAASLMGSRRILKGVAEKLGLQGEIQSGNEEDTLFSRIKANFRLAWAALFSRSDFPVLDDPTPGLLLTEVTYSGELPLKLRVRVKDQNTYEAAGDIPIMEGTFGSPLSFESLSLNLSRKDSTVSETYDLTVYPLQKVVKELNKIVEITPCKSDKSLLKMKCSHGDRVLASRIVNAIMDSYQDYLKGYHGEVAASQLDYLSFRRGQLMQNLGDLMQRHADSLTSDLSNSGFMDSIKEMDFLARSQHEYKQKLLDNELEIKRLNSIHPSNLAYYDRFSLNEGDPVVINGILSEMRALKQQRDALEVELQKKTTQQRDDRQEAFNKQLDELREVQQHRADLKEAETAFQSGVFPKDSSLFNDPRFLLREWLENIQNAKQEGNLQSGQIHHHFQQYLNNLDRSFGVHERILLERLIHQQKPSAEFQGITLDVATNLYLDYSKQLVQLEGTIRQNLFIIRQIDDPDFEITSLSSGLEDEISRDMIRKAGELVLNLRDQNNQSTREQDRIKDELSLQRTFLKMHLKQKNQLLDLHKELIDEKILALENISLELIHQSILILEKNLQDYLQSRLENLQQERVLIQRHLENIHSEMALLPQKWVSEKLLTEEVETNQKIVEEIAKLVESKNISHNLDVIQSAPIDAALPPLHPIKPPVFLWGFLGFLLGGFLGSSAVIGRELSRGLRADAENLTRMGLHVSGSLNEDDHDSLRRLQSYLDGEGIGKLVLLLEGQGPHYSPELAGLFLKRGCKVLTLELSFTENQKISSPGLLQYLEGTIQHVPIRKGKKGDWLGAGGASPFLVEQLHSPRFKELLNQLQTEYDWILAYSSTSPAQGEARALLDLFPRVASTLTTETVEDLMPYFRWQEAGEGNKLSFFFFERKTLQPLRFSLLSFLRSRLSAAMFRFRTNQNRKHGQEWPLPSRQ